MKRSVLALALAVSLATTVASTAAAGGRFYPTCDAVHRDFPRGVAKDRAAANRQVREGNERPSISGQARAVYRENHTRLDRDRDGTACEV